MRLKCYLTKGELLLDIMVEQFADLSLNRVKLIPEGLIKW